MPDDDLRAVQQRLDRHEGRLDGLEEMAALNQRVLYGEPGPDGSHREGLVDKLKSALADITAIREDFASFVGMFRRGAFLVGRGALWFVGVALPAAVAAGWAVATHLHQIATALKDLAQ